MKIVVMSARNGEIHVEDIPSPQMVKGQVLVRNHFSLISAGTERATVKVGQQSLVGKARQRPEQVRQVMNTVRQVGPLETYRMVTDRLDAPMVLGYSSAGRVVAVGDGVDDLEVGGLVAAGGGGYASHAEVVAVPRQLCVPVPDGVSAQTAAFGTVGAIALHGIHQVQCEPGSRVAVIGLGLVGQLTVRLLACYGYDAIGIDTDPTMLDLAARAGVAGFKRDQVGLEGAVQHHWRASGADGVLITAATKSSDPVELAGSVARDRAHVVVVGDVGVAPPRSSYYGKELTISYSRSYGPGRYDPQFEEEGINYPVGYVPWTERRNMAEFLRLLAQGRLDLSTLEPAVYPVEQAATAYAQLDIKGPDRRVAIVLSYGSDDEPLDLRADDHGNGDRPRRVEPRPWRARVGTVRVAAVGAGSFPTRMLFPHLKRNPEVAFSWITTSSGLTAAYQGPRLGFQQVAASFDEGLADRDTDAVMVLTRHDSHGRLAAEVLNAGLALFCEKPLGLTEEELNAVAQAWQASGAPALVGFNRRFAPAVQAVREAVAGRGPLQVSYRVFAGKLPSGHWYFDPAQGGRLLGEVCHFVDLAGYLVGAQPTRIMARSAEGSADPVKTQSVSLQVEYTDGSIASIVYGGRTPSGAPKELIEVAGDGVAARVEDFASTDIWTGQHRRLRHRGGPKGHAEEMAAFVALLRGHAQPAADFRSALWSSLATVRAAESLGLGHPVEVMPAQPALRAALTDTATG